MSFCVCCRDTINELEFSQVASVAALLLLDVVIQKQLSAHVVHIELIRLYVGRFGGNLVDHFVLFTDDRCSGIQLFKVVYDGVLDVDISFREDICAACACIFVN